MSKTKHFSECVFFQLTINEEINIVLNIDVIYIYGWKISYNF